MKLCESGLAALAAAAAWWPPEIYGELRGPILACAFGLFLWETLRGRVVPPPWLGAAAGLLILNVTFAANYRYAALETALPLAAYMLVGILAFGIEPRRHAVFIHALAAVGAALSLYGMYQAGWGLEAAAGHTRAMAASPEKDAILDRLASGRVISRFALPATFGGWLALALPPVVGAVLAAEGKRARRLLWSAAALMGGGLLLALSMGAVAALIAAAAMTFIFTARGGLRRAKWLFAALALAVVLLGGLAATRSWEWTRERRNMTHHPAWSRLANWQSAAEMWKESPALGKGLGAYGLEYPRFMHPGMNETQYAHNSYLQMAAEGGALAVLLLAWFLWRWGRGFGSARDPLSLGLETGCLAFLIHNAADFTLYMPSVGLPFAALTGLLIRRRLDLGGNAPFPAPPPAWTRTLAASGAGVALALVFFMSNADRHYRLGALEYESGESTARAVESLRRAQTWFPWRAEPFIYEARIWLRSPDGGAAERALEKANRAVALNPLTPFHYAARAEAHLRLGDVEKARADYETAARLHPLKPEYASALRRLPPPSASSYLPAGGSK